MRRLAEPETAAQDDDSPPGPEAMTYADFYHASYGRLAAQLSAYLGDPAEAEDIVQEALLRAWQKWASIGRYEDPVSWVRRVAWNLATSRWRRLISHNNWLRRASRTEPSTGALGPDNVALIAALRQIPEKHRQAVVLHYIADLSVADIASDLGVPRGTVLSWLSRGRTQLASLLADA
ncbi:RNA polymerase sigma factor [Longispora albida]|uniref:RNA polymerase sigma factor n=1 Tax=Longispora albida TaxID=203523 RepID=UPI001FE0AA19|nr:SigE family RNA polymerase sigma factor [Longispora albida]